MSDSAIITSRNTQADENGRGRSLLFEPGFRLPHSPNWQYVGRKRLLVDRASRMIGFRVSVEGLFKSALDIRPYPFDPETRGGNAKFAYADALHIDSKTRGLKKNKKKRGGFTLWNETKKKTGFSDSTFKH